MFNSACIKDLEWLFCAALPYFYSMGRLDVLENSVGSLALQ